MHKKKFSLFLVFALCLTLCIPALAVGLKYGSDPGQIDEAYQYPIQLRTPEWAALSTREERLAASHVDEAILASMTTTALIETVLNYPMLADIYAFNSIQDGIEHVSVDFRGIEELSRRDDAIVCLNEFTQVAARSAASLITKCYLEDITAYAENSYAARLPNSQRSLPETTLYTPNGSAVIAYPNLTWDVHGRTYEKAVAQTNELLAIHTTATLIANPSPTYNCHSYAWYSATTTNKNWIDDPGAYMSDGSYSQKSWPTVGYKVFWDNGGHSAIVNNMAGGIYNPTLHSKWGSLGLISHPLNDSPYGSGVTYWSR